ncbi:unnamed protein product [Urochloa humidicola]
MGGASTARYPACLPLPPRESDSGRHDATSHLGARRDGQDQRRHGGRDGGAPRRSSGRSCRDMDFVWLQRQDGDDDHYDHPGRGGQARGRGESRHDSDTVRRERTRSPRRRDAEFRGGRRHGHDDEDARRRSRPPLGALQTRHRSLVDPLPDADQLGVISATNLHEIFRAKALELKHTLLQARGSCTDAWLQEATDYINKACGLAAQTGGTPQPGNVAWSASGEHLIPSSLVFDRLRRAMAPSVAELERALHAIELRNNAVATAAMAAATAEPAPGAGNELGQASERPNSAGSDRDRAVQTAPIPPMGQPWTVDASMTQANNTGRSKENTVQAQPISAPQSPSSAGRSPLRDPSMADNGDAAMIGDLFSMPTPAVLPSLPPRAPRKRRTFDMSVVRRSARLANKSVQPPVLRAQRTLCRKLGIPADELRSIDDVLQDFISMFTGPLPDSIMAAMTAVFDLDDEDAEDVNDALLRHADEAIDDLQEGLEAPPA